MTQNKFSEILDRYEIRNRIIQEHLDAAKREMDRAFEELEEPIRISKELDETVKQFFEYTNQFTPNRKLSEDPKSLDECLRNKRIWVNTKLAPVIAEAIPEMTSMEYLSDGTVEIVRIKNGSATKDIHVECDSLRAIIKDIVKQGGLDNF